MEPDHFVRRRQAAPSCGFLVTVANDCPAGCTAAPIAGLFGAVSGTLSCKDLVTATSSVRTASSTPGIDITTVTFTNRVTVRPTTTFARTTVPAALTSASNMLVTSSPSSTLATTSSTSTITSSASSSLSTLPSSTSPTPTAGYVQASGSNSFAQTTGGILTITFVTLGILAAVVLGVIFWRRRQQRQRQHNTRTGEPGEPMAELPSERSSPGGLDAAIPYEDHVGSPPQTSPTAVVGQNSSSGFRPASDELPREIGGALPPRHLLSPNRFRFSTATTDTAGLNSRRASSIYPEDQAELPRGNSGSFESHHGIIAPTPHRRAMTHDEHMVRMKREHDASGGYGIPEIPSDGIEREKLPWEDVLARITGRDKDRTDRWDPNATRGVPPIPERNPLRRGPSGGPIARKPVG